MSKILGLFVLMVAVAAVSGYHDSGKLMRHKRMSHKEELLQEEEMNGIDHGPGAGKKQRVKFNEEFAEETSYPKKLSHKKKASGNKKHHSQEEEDGHAKILGHRGEQEWRLKKKKHNRIDPDQDLHLQDLAYPQSKLDKGEDSKEFADKKKHKKDKKEKKKYNKEKKEQKQKQKKEKESKHKNKKSEKENRP